MPLTNIAENTGNTLMMAFVTNFIGNAFKNRSFIAKSNISYKNSLHQTKSNFINSIVCESIGNVFDRTPNTFTGSFIANFLTERKKLSLTSLKNSIYSGFIANFIEKLQKTYNN